MKSIITKFFVLAVFICCLTSCVSTEVYDYQEDKFYEDGELVSEIYTGKRNGKLVKKDRNVFQKIYVGNGYVASVKHSEDMKKKNGEATVYLYKDGKFLTECEFSEKKGVFKPERKLGNSENSIAIKEAIEFLKEDDIETQLKKTDGSLYRNSLSGKVTVESKTDGKYLAYSFLGKPFVILGSATWGLIKCVGYSFANFMGGMNFGMGGNNYWVMPSVKEAVEKRKKAKAENTLSYPEFHKPFTKNHIIVEAMQTKTENLFTGAEKTIVTASEVRAYDNTIKISKSAEADAASIASVVNVVGNVVTIPVSGFSWFCGLVYGVGLNSYN